MEVISNKEAKSLGLKKYFTGKPCKNGHISERWVGQHGKCVACGVEASVLWKKNNPEKVKAIKARWNAKKQPEVSSYNRKYAKYPEATREYPKDGRCEVCGELETRKRPDGNIRELSLDHCHETHKFRGWLCCGCNLAIGNCKDNPETLEKLAKYLRNNIV